MASMKYCDKHNQVGFLKKPEESTGFAEIVDFLKGSHIRYALTHNLTIHDSLVKQFWQTATASTLADGTLELRATIDTLEYTITEASVRSKLQLADASGISMLPNTEIFEGMGNMGYPADGTFTFWKSHFTPQWRFLVHHILHCMSPKSGGWDQFGSNLATALICLSTGRIYNFSKLIFDGMVANLKSKTKFLMYPRFLQMILEIQTENKHPYLAIVLTKKIFGNMKRGFRGVPRPLLPAMLPVVAVDQSAGQADQAVDQPSPSEPLPSSSHPPVLSATTKSEPTPETEVPQSQDPIHPHVAEERTMTVDDLLQLVPKLIYWLEEVNTGGLGVSTGSGQVSSARGQREGKAPMIVEETQAPKRTEEQIQQEEASLAEAIRLQTLEEEETAKQVYLDALLAKRLAEEEEAKLEANAELTKDVLGKDLSEQDFAKRMVDLVNQRKKYFAEKKAKEKRNKPMTQSQLRIYMSNYLKNQGTWKLSQLKKLKFEEIKEEFEKLVKQIDTFVPINIEATKAQLKRYGEELQTEISKKQRIDDKDVSDTEEKVGKVKEEEPVKRVGKRKKQKARKGISIDKSPQGDSETDKEESVEAMNPTPLDTKSNIVANWKIFKQGKRSIYQIIRANGADTVYISFGAMLKDLTREDLIELYRLVMQKYGTNRPEDAYDRVLWSDLRTMFDPPLNEDAIWSLPLQQKMTSWKYYDKCAVHCLTLEACNIYMLADRKYHLSKDACQVMLKMKLLDGKINEVFYKLLKMIEKQADVKK
ncbi:hypothetical protein Tco_0295086 [Tanacetum coccineum]